jgi:hypothetical protein
VSVRTPGRGKHTGNAVAATAAVLAVLAAAGCSAQPAAPGASVQSCTQFGSEAIRHHVTVTSLPPACRGLTRAQVNLAVGSALFAAAIGAHGKARERARIAGLSHFLQRLVTTVPAPRSQPPVAAPSARPSGRGALGLIAAGTWLVTLALGLWMLARWAAGGRLRRAQAGQPQRPPALNLAHLGLASTGLLAWIAYLATGVTAVAWAACALLLPVAGLGMALVFLLAAARPADGAATVPAAPGTTPGVPAGDGTSRARRPPVLAIGAHIAFATATILLAFLTAVGTG